MLALTIAMVTSLGIAERVSAQGMGITIGAAPGVGVASPVSKVFEKGAQWGTTFTAAVGCRFNRWEIALEPWLMYTATGPTLPKRILIATRYDVRPSSLAEAATSTTGIVGMLERGWVLVRTPRITSKGQLRYPAIGPARVATVAMPLR
jgi:hypothetical protein